MQRSIRAFVSYAIITATAATAGAAEPAKTHQVRLNGHTFTLPTGFEIEQVAGPPVVDRPIVADFDEEGRLYVADSSGSNDPVQVQLLKRPHRILRLEDIKGNGHFERRTVFADKMMFPEGAMWFAGSLHVAAPPSIWKLTDTKNTGVADQRVEWFQGKTLTGCANDLHGPYLGPDGWIYWCKGAFAKQTYDRPGRPPLVTRAAHIFRCRPDGSGIEPVMTGGMDNPVEVVFTPGGERIFTTTFLQRPGGGRRDGIIHAIYGGIYGKDQGAIYEHPWTGPDLMPVLTHLGPAAPAGLVRYESAVFGPEYQGNLFAALFNMHKVTRHVLTPSGATFAVRDEDFVVSDNFDFHPTDVLEDADGSLLVIDTGGWYKLCCPTSQLHKPDILGAIYRVRRTGARALDDPRGAKLAWATMSAAELGRLLDDARPAVRRRAIQSLAVKGAAALAVLDEIVRTSASSEARLSAVWCATRIDGPEARGLARTALADRDEIVRQAAIHSASVWRDREAVPVLLSLLESPALQNRRAAAEALGRMGDKHAVPGLLAAAGDSEGPGKAATPSSGAPERILQHSLTYALIEIAAADETKAGLRSPNWRTRRAALVALDQMDGARVSPEAVAAELDSPSAELAHTALWIASRHPEWGSAMAGFLRRRLSASDLSTNQSEELIRQLAIFARSAPIQDMLAERAQSASASKKERSRSLRAMAQAGLKETPRAWTVAVVNLLPAPHPRPLSQGERGDSELVREAIAAARTFHVDGGAAEDLTAALIRIGNDPGAANAERLGALAAVPGGLREVSPALFTFVLGELASDRPSATRSLAAEVLSKAKLKTDQLILLCHSFRDLGPMDVDRVLEAFAQSTDDAIGQALIASLKTSPARAGLRAEMVKPRIAKFGQDVQKAAAELYALLNADAQKQRVRLEELLGTLAGGDIRRGQLVFNSSKASCSACHAIGYMGGNVGPDLTHIGRIRAERDLLEAIVFPSASFVRSYEPVLVYTKAGRSFNGVIRKDSADEVVLATGVNQEARIPRQEIEDIQPSKVSIMPAGFDQQLTPRELADLVAFLKACK